MDIDFSKKRKQVSVPNKHKKHKARTKLYKIIDEAINDISGLQNGMDITDADKHELRNDLILIAKYLYVRITGFEVVSDNSATDAPKLEESDELKDVVTSEYQESVG
jgi:hypothetical protein